jgi:hypothetical protein
MRVFAHNPQIPIYERSNRVEPDWHQWRIVDVNIKKLDGGQLDATLFRSPEWMELHNVQVGSCVAMDTPELNALGEAVVLAIRAPPLVETSPGEVVTATFRHTAADIIDIATLGTEDVIGTTTNHPFWSESRQAFVEASALEVGESLKTFTGRITQITSITPRGPPEPVYNFTVYGEHVYYVGPSGILVHNAEAYTGPIDYGSIPTEHQWRYQRYLNDPLTGTLGPEDWLKRAQTIWANNRGGNTFERQVREALGAPLGVGSKPSNLDGYIPDLPAGLRYGVTDIKDWTRLDVDDQLRSFFQHASSNDLPFNLIISPRTMHISEPLLEMVRETNGRVFQFDPITRTFSNISIGLKGLWKRPS